MYQKRPTYVSKETYTVVTFEAPACINIHTYKNTHKTPLMLGYHLQRHQKKATYVSKETYICIKRDLHMYQKRPTRSSPLTHTHTHTQLHTNTHKSRCYVDASGAPASSHTIHIHICTYIYTCAYMHTYTYIYTQNSFFARLAPLTYNTHHIHMH
jgi:hypothetical protein